ncbi:PAS domain-containing sensor histidine kinase [Haloarcula nitratireducens]|uniref:histidine kinase n=1 Tax=Haloarcula nitratireducens TaxID=2487749 RepID=A0AAW4P9B1_9EURY|nr:PAS domain-containing sensor histidine kinase [Halomicroarcula nitratireducens]MBX0294474.1 PAS domain S-box protein [Halomicroarcula nitratireducens]
MTDCEADERHSLQFEAVFESLDQPVYVVNEAGRFVRANDAFAELTGREEGTLVGEPVATVLKSGRDEGPSEAGADEERTVVTPSGDRIPCEVSVTPLTTTEGESKSVGVVRDISRRAHLESELAEVRERLQTLIEASPLAIVAADEAGVVDVWNPAAESLFGWSTNEICGEPLAVLPVDHRAELQRRHERVLDGDRLTGVETQLRHRGGHTLDVSVSIAPIRGKHGDILGSVAIIADISDQKDREERLQEQNERLDEFASIVSHDLRNPLQVASGSLELARHEATPEVEDRLDSIGDALERMEALVEDTLTLAREGQDIEDTEVVDLRIVAQGAWNGVFTEGAACSIETSRTVLCDPGRLTELFENLFRNALEHGGTDESPVTVTVGELEDGFYVADDGPGIPADERDAVFESGYTTVGDGTGFGLAIVETIADAHDWDVTLTESEDGGARFEFTDVERTT